MRNLTERTGNGSRITIGTMSGTSTDGYDIALTRITGSGPSMRVEVLASNSVPLPVDVIADIYAVYPPGRVTVRRVAELQRRLSELHAAWISQFVQDQGFALSDIDLIGYHGVALYHGSRTSNSVPVHLEIGDGAIVAERTGCTVVANLRSRDVAAGGEGAPLSPYADWILFRDNDLGRAIQNIGGIANVTGIRPSATLEDLIAFDTGPGNMVIDALMMKATNGQVRYDQGGRVAATGHVSRLLLGELMKTPYIRRGLPKSTGREVFGEAFSSRLLDRSASLGLRFEDIIATVTAFTAEAIADHYERFLFPRFPVSEVIITGGGHRNTTLLQMISDRLHPIPVRNHAEFGIHPDIREAVTWAMLASESIDGRPANVPTVTGATHPVVLGEIHRGSR